MQKGRETDHSLVACDDRRHNDALVSSGSDHALFSPQAGDIVSVVHKPGAVELFLPHGRGENHRQVQPGCREDGEGESGGDDAE